MAQAPGLGFLHAARVCWVDSFFGVSLFEKEEDDDTVTSEEIKTDRDNRALFPAMI